MLVAVLRCVECGRASHGTARHWRAYRTYDGSTAVYCPTCAVREFGPCRRPRRFVKPS